MRGVLCKLVFGGWMRPPTSVLLAGVMLATSGAIAKAHAQDSADSSNDSASKMAASRYADAGSNYRGPGSSQIMNEDTGGSPESLPRARVATVESIPQPAEVVSMEVISQAETIVRELGPYQVIVDRNAFGLSPLPVANANLHTAVDTAPVPDLVLTGVFGVGSVRCALFKMMDHGSVTASFMLQEGEQNDWLEIRSVDAEKEKVTVFLKKPVMRIRNSGTEVILSFESHGAGH